MTCNLVARDTVECICSIEESILLRQALFSFQYENEQYMRMFENDENDPAMERIFINAKENTEKAEELLRQLHW